MMACGVFRQLCVLFLVILVTVYSANAFRLIRTTGRDSELSAEESKEQVRKVTTSFKDEYTRYKNQSTKFHMKRFDDDETDEDDDDEDTNKDETIKHVEKRLKIVLPVNMTKGMYSSVKERKVDILKDELDEDDDDEDSETKEVNLKKDNKLDKEKIAKIHESHLKAKEAKRIEIKPKEEPIKEKKGLDKEKIAKIHEKHTEVKHEKSKDLEIKVKEEPVKEKKGLDKEKIAKIHEKHTEAKHEKSEDLKVKVKEEPVKEKKGLDKEKIAKIHEKHTETKEEKSKYVEIKAKEKTEEPKEKKTLDKEKIAKIHEKHAEAKEDIKTKVVEKIEQKSKEPEKPEKKPEKIIDKTATKNIEPEKPKEKKILEKKEDIPKAVEKIKPAKEEKKITEDKKQSDSKQKKITEDENPLDSKQKKIAEDKKQSDSKQKKITEDKKQSDSKQKKITEDKKQSDSKQKKITEDKKPTDIKNKTPVVKDNTKAKVDKPPVVKEKQISKEKSLPKENPTPNEPKLEIKSGKAFENLKSQNTFGFGSESDMLYYNLPSFSPNFEAIQSEECKKQGRILLEQLHLRKLWALKMFDSTAKIPSGILKGNLNQFGDYDQCTSIFVKLPATDPKEADVRISGKYCLANIDFEAEIHEMKLSVHLAQSRSLIRSKLRDPGHFIPRFTTIRWGICMPAGCTAYDAEQIIEDSIRLYNDSSVVGVHFDVSVDSNQCYVRKASKKLLDYHYTTLATLCVFATIVLFVVISSIRDLKIIKSDENTQEISNKMDQMLMSFSLKRTFATLLKRDTAPDEIKCIHGIKTLCTFALYIAHKLIPIGHLPFTNKVTLTEISNNPFSVILRLSIIYTDSFLLLSGVLTSYGMSKDIEVTGRIPWFNRMIARFIRIAPSLLFVLLYYAYVMEILGEGPLWNTVITPNADLCKDYWWRNILFIQNVYPFQDMCATHTHQLALDMQLSLVAPILVWLLYKRPLLGVFVTIMLHIASLVLRYYATVNYRLSLVIYHGISISQLYRTANMLYASSIHRATPYIAGVGLGVLLRQMKPNFTIHKVLAVIGWLVAGYFASWTLYTPAHLASRMYIYNVDEAAQHAALCSLAWALALSWTIFACCADIKGYLNSLLSSRPMVLFSRISYTVYLTQFMVFFYNVGTVRSAAEFKIITSIDLSEIITVLVVSTILTLFVDIPAQKIKEILLKSAPSVDVPANNSACSNNITKTSNQKEITEKNFEEDPVSEMIDDNPISEAIYDEYEHNIDDDITEQLDDDDYLQKLDFEEIHKSEEMQ